MGKGEPRWINIELLLWRYLSWSLKLLNYISLKRDSLFLGLQSLYVFQTETACCAEYCVHLPRSLKQIKLRCHSTYKCQKKAM